MCSGAITTSDGPHREVEVIEVNRSSESRTLGADYVIDYTEKTSPGTDSGTTSCSTWLGSGR